MYDSIIKQLKEIVETPRPSYGPVERIQRSRIGPSKTYRKKKRKRIS